MKLRIGSKNKYDKWFSSFRMKAMSPYGEDETRWTDIDKVIRSTPPTDYQIIDVPPTIKISELIQKIAGAKPVTTHKTRDGRTLIKEHYLYCLSASADELDTAKSLSDYPIEEDDVLLLGIYEHVEPDMAVYRALLWRDVTDFSRIVRERKDFEQSKGLMFRPPPPPKGVTSSLLGSWSAGSAFHRAGLRPVEGVLLYTDEDVDIAKYVRLNFSYIDVMTGHHLNLYVLENPTKIKGISPRTYWKAYLDGKLYLILTLLGWTRTKPYAKEETYKIAEKLGLYSDALPCLTVFGDITSDEKIVLSIGDDLPGFFRAVSSVVQRTMEDLLRDLRDYTQWPGFQKFKEKFISRWEKFESVVLKRENATTFTFNGNTVFIHKPQGKIELKKFQSEVKKNE